MKEPVVTPSSLMTMSLVVVVLLVAVREVASCTISARIPISWRRVQLGGICCSSESTGVLLVVVTAATIW